MSGRNWPRLAKVVLWAPILIYAALIARQFFRYAGVAIHLSTDDAVANIAYALAEEGRYGFLSSPVLQDMPRYQGLFSYGPYYFYLGAALIWLFGYSLTLLRSIHLGVILFLAAAGQRWFDRGWAGIAGGALMAVGLLSTFERAHWPMVRPDIMVSLFAALLVMCAGTAMRTGRARWWVGAGCAAACGAFSHLVAWSLVPAAVILLGIHLAMMTRADGRWWPRAWQSLLALAIGGLAGASVFYASFGFRFADQYRFLTGYQELTGSMAAMEQPGAAFADLLSRHFKAAYWYLPYPLEYLVWATLGAGVVVPVSMLIRGEGELRKETLSLIAPPVVVWLAYLLSLGVFNNFHSGYAMLNQVMWLWTGAALVCGCPDLFHRWPVVRRALVSGAWAAAFVLAWGAITIFAPRTDYRALQAAGYTPIDAYVANVQEPIPARAASWGSVIFGIEHPGRLQLVQFSEAIDVLERHPAVERPSLAPDYIVWGHYENRYHTLEVVAGEINPFNVQLLPRMATALPATRYLLVSMTSGAPYGVTRVYARTEGAAGFGQPIVSLYDPAHHRWNRALGTAVRAEARPVEPARLHVGPESQSRPHSAVQTLRVEWPAGTYLLRVGMSGELTARDEVAVVAGPTMDLRDAFAELGPEFDVSPWLAGESAVHVIYTHPGGAAFISQFGARPAMTGVEARPILSLPDFSAGRRPPITERAIAASEWQASFPEITVTRSPDGSSVAVVGNRVQFGYQAYGPKIAVEPGQRVRLRVPVTVTAGSACLGVLDGTGMRWLVAPDRLLTEYEFVAGEGPTVLPVLANCSGFPTDVVPIQAVIGPAIYAVWSDTTELYIDQLMRGFRTGANER